MKFLKNVMIYFLCANFALLGSAYALETKAHLASDLGHKLQELKERTRTETNFRNKLLENLEKEEGKKILEAYGVDKDEFKKRMMAMSENDIRQMLQNDKQVGGEVIIVSLTTILLVVIIILLID